MCCCACRQDCSMLPLPCRCLAAALLLIGHRPRTPALNPWACIILLHSAQPPFAPLAFLPGSLRRHPAVPAAVLPQQRRLPAVRLLCCSLQACCVCASPSTSLSAGSRATQTLTSTAATWQHAQHGCPVFRHRHRPFGATCCALLPCRRWQTGADRFNSYCDKNKNLARLIAGAAVAGLRGSSYHRH